MYSILNEPNFLRKLTKYDFLPKIISSFQDYENFYLVTTFYEGESLNYLRNQILTEEQLKFVSACVIQCLINLRKEKIIHRDIMMKNIIMDNDKYFNVIDFSFSINYLDKDIDKNNMITYNRVTPPEMLNNSEYDYNSDYYRLGSIIYYLIFKQYPYTIKKNNNISDIFIEYKNIENYTFSCIDFLNKLLISDYKKRIGFKDIKELINHHWFKGFAWKKLEKRNIKSPFNFYNKSQESTCSEFIISKSRVIRYKQISKKKFYQFLTKNFDYVNLKIITNFKREVK